MSIAPSAFKASTVKSISLGGEIAELERRRRALLADYGTLKSRPLAVDAIEDAEVVT